LEALRHIRTMRGMNQVDLAKASGVAQNTISEIELGKREARPGTLKKLADALGVEIADFFPKGHSPLSAKRALTLADSDAFRREAREASTEELQQTALELARFTKPQTREELVRDKDNKEIHLKEAHRRVIAHERIGIINVVLDDRGAPSPVELVARQFNDAMSPAEEPSQRGQAGQEGQETA
jgi:transcriptional regulator with XRE-family HTH domain